MRVDYSGPSYYSALVRELNNASVIRHSHALYQNAVTVLHGIERLPITWSPCNAFLRPPVPRLQPSASGPGFSAANPQ